MTAETGTQRPSGHHGPLTLSVELRRRITEHLSSGPSSMIDITQAMQALDSTYTRSNVNHALSGLYVKRKVDRVEALSKRGVPHYVYSLTR